MRPALCIGESLVDLICERPVASFEEADAFVQHLGGAATNVAVHAAREGAHIALGGGAGDDPWGRWLRRRLAQEGVELRFWRLLPRTATAEALPRAPRARRGRRRRSARSGRRRGPVEAGAR